ncbi:MAG: filamentous hemagglutinin, partial [Burkholderiales bacterium PBB4]
MSLGAVSGNFIDKNAGTGKTVNIAGLTLSGADARNYALSSTTATASANIAPKVLTTGGYQVTSKVYDGNRSAAVTGGVLSGALAGDSVSLTSVVASFSDKNAGLAKPVTIAGGLLSGADAGNYSLSSSGSTATADIVPRPVTVGGLSANNKVYDGTTLAVVSGGVVTGAVAGDTVSVNVGASAFADKNVGTGKLISVSGVALAGADALNYSLASTSTSLTANIAARPVTVGSISVSGKTYDGTTAAQVSGGSLLGAVSGDAGSIGALSGSFLDKNVGTNKPVVLSGLVLNGGDASNYSLNPGSVSAVASIAPRVVSVSALTAGDKVYDGTTSATLLGGVLSGAVAGDNVALAPVSGNFLDKNVGAAKPVAVSGLSLTGGDAGNYTLGLVGVNASASITPKPLVVSGITALNKPYDGKTDATIDTSKAVLSGLVAGDLVTTTEMKAAFADKNAGTAKKVLLTGLGLTGADARNYTFSGDSVTTADITVRESSNWLGAAGDLWSDPKNWDVVPEGANVRSVVFPANT